MGILIVKYIWPKQGGLNDHVCWLLVNIFRCGGIQNLDHCLYGFQESIIFRLSIIPVILLWCKTLLTHSHPPHRRHSSHVHATVNKQLASAASKDQQIVNFWRHIYLEYCIRDQGSVFMHISKRLHICSTISLLALSRNEMALNVESKITSFFKFQYC